MEKQTYFHGTGRRKCAVAQVRLMAGTGAIIVNGEPFEKMFPSQEHQRVIKQPLVLTETADKFNVVIKVAGGGISGQSGAICHGISRALVQSDERFKHPLRQNGFLTRDSRIKERKKAGLKRSRKAPQYTKR